MEDEQPAAPAAAPTLDAHLAAAEEAIQAEASEETSSHTSSTQDARELVMAWFNTHVANTWATRTSEGANALLAALPHLIEAVGARLASSNQKG